MSFFTRSSTWIGAVTIAMGLTMFTPTRAFAQNKPGTWDVTPFMSFGFGSDLIGVSPGVGVAGGYNWTPNLSFEGEFNWFPDVVGGDNNVDEPVVSVSGNGVYSFNTGTNFIPYATLGLGIGHTNITIQNPPYKQSTTGFEVNTGGGLKIDLSPKLTVRGDLRYFHMNDQPNFWRFYAGIVFKFPR